MNNRVSHKGIIEVTTLLQQDNNCYELFRFYYKTVLQMGGIGKTVFIQTLSC